MEGDLGMDGDEEGMEVESGFSPEAKAIRPPLHTPALSAAGSTPRDPKKFYPHDLQLQRAALQEMLSKRGIELDPELQPYACDLLVRARVAEGVRLRQELAKADALSDDGLENKRYAGQSRQVTFHESNPSSQSVGLGTPE